MKLTNSKKMNKAIIFFIIFLVVVFTLYPPQRNNMSLIKLTINWKISPQGTYVPIIWAKYLFDGDSITKQNEVSAYGENLVGNTPIEVNIFNICSVVIFIPDRHKKDKPPIRLTVSWEDSYDEGIFKPSIGTEYLIHDGLITENSVSAFGEYINKDKYLGVEMFNNPTSKTIIKILANRMKEIDQRRISNIYLENSVRCELVIEDSNDKKLFIVYQGKANEQIEIPKIVSPGNHHFKVIWE